MNSREHLAEDLETITKRAKQINYVAWGVAIFVMAYGTPIVYSLATAHGIPSEVAWMLSLAADGSLCVGLIATPVLASIGVSAGWVGTLRWVSGFITWALQTGESWTHPGGPDLVGVGVHTAGPLLLFFAVEGASYFHRKVSDAITERRRELEQAEHNDADRRAHLAKVEADLRSARAELSAAHSEIDTLTARLNATTEASKAVNTEHDNTVERLRAENNSLRQDLATQAEKLTAKHAEDLRRAKEKYAEKLAEIRAEYGAVNINTWRKGRTATTSPRGSNRPAMSDEDAVQLMYDKHSDPNHEWSQNSVRTLTGAGFGRIPNLIAAWREKALGEADGDRAVNQ